MKHIIKFLTLITIIGCILSPAYAYSYSDIIISPTKSTVTQGEIYKINAQLVDSVTKNPIKNQKLVLKLTSNVYDDENPFYLITAYTDVDGKVILPINTFTYFPGTYYANIYYYGTWYNTNNGYWECKNFSKFEIQSTE